MLNANIYVSGGSAGVLKLALVISAFILAVFLAFQLLEINIDFKMGNVTLQSSDFAPS